MILKNIFLCMKIYTIWSWKRKKSTQWKKSSRYLILLICGLKNQQGLKSIMFQFIQRQKIVHFNAFYPEIKKQGRKSSAFPSHHSSIHSFFPQCIRPNFRTTAFKQRNWMRNSPLKMNGQISHDSIPEVHIRTNFRMYNEKTLICTLYNRVPNFYSARLFICWI